MLIDSQLVDRVEQVNRESSHFLFAAEGGEAYGPRSFSPVGMRRACKSLRDQEEKVPQHEKCKLLTDQQERVEINGDCAGL